MVHLRVELLAGLLIMEPLVAALVLLGWWQEKDPWGPPVHPFTWSLRRVGLKFKHGVPCGHLHWVSCSSQELELWLRIEVSAKVQQFSICLPSTILCSCELYIPSNRSLSDMPRLISLMMNSSTSKDCMSALGYQGWGFFGCTMLSATLVCFRGSIGVAMSKLWYPCWYFDPQSKFLLLSGVRSFGWGLRYQQRYENFLFISLLQSYVAANPTFCLIGLSLICQRYFILMLESLTAKDCMSMLGYQGLGLLGCSML